MAEKETEADDDAPQKAEENKVELDIPTKKRDPGV